MRARALIDRDALGFQVGKSLITLVAQEERLPSVADENIRIVGIDSLCTANSDLSQDKGSTAVAAAFRPRHAA